MHISSPVTPYPAHPPRATHLITTARAAAKTAVCLFKVFPMLPSRPLDWVTPHPVVERLRYRTSHGDAEGDLYGPSSPGPHPGVVVCLGVVPFGVDHPQVPRLGEALARSGFAALLYWSPAMRDFRLDPADVEDIASAYEALLAQPDIDAARSGLLGTCVGGAFALMGATSPRIRERVTFVSAYAPYASMWTLARDISSASRCRDGIREPWTVDRLTRKVYVHSVTALIEAHEAERLRDACAERDGQPDIAGLSEVGQAVLPLLTALDPDEAEDALQHLPGSLRERLSAMSPTTYLRDLRARSSCCCMIAMTRWSQSASLDTCGIRSPAMAGCITRSSLSSSISTRRRQPVTDRPRARAHPFRTRHVSALRAGRGVGAVHESCGKSTSRRHPESTSPSVSGRPGSKLHPRLLRPHAAVRCRGHSVELLAIDSRRRSARRSSDHGGCQAQGPGTPS